MPKIVDHVQRREEIALVACQVVAKHGLEKATMARIAKAAGYTTGMVAHYYRSKQEIILAALRLMLIRIEARLVRERSNASANLRTALSETLPLDEARATECAFWMAFWSQVPSDKSLQRLNEWVREEYTRQYARCFAKYWPEWCEWPSRLRSAVLRRISVCINGLTVLAVTSPEHWPPRTQSAFLEAELQLLRRWAGAQHDQPLAMGIP